MDTELMRACDMVWTAMFRAKLTNEEIETLKALRWLINNILGLCKRKENEK